jgi:hypothetical protein
MIELFLKPVKATPAAFASLERRNLIRMLRPTPKILATRTKTGAVDVFHRSSPEHGGHMLLGIGKRATEIRLSAHPENEEFILINPLHRAFKPLYLVVSFDRQQTLERKIKNRTLVARDFAVLELRYNDPATCVFTMLKGTVHCEVTAPGRGMHPVFFVAEPSRMKSARITAPGYRLKIACDTRCS